MADTDSSSRETTPRSCEEWWSARGNRTRLPVSGKNVTIDLDGGGPMKSMQVVCKMMKDDMGIATILEHDLKRPIFVTGDNNPGVVRKALIYGVSTEQMDRLVEGFESCSQYMRFSCRGGARLMTQECAIVTSGEDATDEGVNPYSQLLPVTGLFLGGTTKASSIEVEMGTDLQARRA
ncbi:hypothetical protein OSTOST_03969 [Ostertagia ostertagi]